MRVSNLKIKNFRLLKEVDLTLEERATVIVGRNNSGKTSLTEVFRRLLSDKPSFRIEDFSMCAHEEFWKAMELKEQGKDETLIRQALPKIELELSVSYEKDMINLGALSDFIIDLNPDCTSVIISISYELAEGKISSLFDNLKFDDSKKNDFFMEVKERVPKFYKCSLKAVDPNDPSNFKLLEWNKLQSLLRSGFINAQRGLDDETYKDKDVLGKILETLFTTAKSESADTTDHLAAKGLEDAVKGVEKDLDKKFNENLKSLVPALSLFGYPGLSDPGLLTETTLDVQRLLINNTKIRYAGTNGISLPEAFNGLGARNLIFILFKLLEFFKQYKTSQGAPGINLVFIEEPEAHLHPQMQEVFIRQLEKVVEIFSSQDPAVSAWPVQFIVSTHSSHIANEAPFSATRYFIAHSLNGSITTEIKDLSTGLSGTSEDVKTFLHKYMTLTRCDLLFADKAILIEGTTERLLLPKIIEKLDSGKTPESALARQYISIVEVGGAYAHKFFPLLNFLELPTLIVTDLDSTKSVTKTSKTVYEACKVSESERTSNACIKDWFQLPELSPADIINKSDADKIKSVCRIAYQIPEIQDGPCGRSFEDAFILTNPSLFGLTGPDEQKAWDLASKLQNKKTEFALEYAIEKVDWEVPRYIKEGLLWLGGKVTIPILIPSELPAATIEPLELMPVKNG